MSASSPLSPGGALPPLRVQVGTFNCNLQGSSAVSPDLSHWLVPTTTETSKTYTSHPSPQGNGRDAPDVYAVGFQELLPLVEGFSNAGKPAMDRTDREIRRAIRPHAAMTRSDGKYPPGGGPEDYAVVARVNLVGIVLYVYARERKPAAGVKSAADRVKEIRTSWAGTGLLGLMGNKGAVGVRVVLEGVTPGSPDEVLTFVCAHLAAHDHQIARRNSDWRNIVQRLAFPPDSVQALPPRQLAPPPSSTDSAPDADKLRAQYAEAAKLGAGLKKGTPLDNKTYTLYETSHLFVFGDLNYRIAVNRAASKALSEEGDSLSPLKKADIKSKIEFRDWTDLARYDQLALEHRAEEGARTMHGLVEPHLPSVGFGPTYKFKVDKNLRKRLQQEDADSKTAATAGKDEVEPSVLSSKRIPGWTDRILWASVGCLEGGEKGTGRMHDHGVETELYRSIMRYTHSDHRPVTAILRLPPVTHASPLLPSSKLTPYTLDPTWRLKRFVGQILDALLGLIWTALIKAGAGSVVAGGLEVVVVALLSWVYLTQGLGGDMGYYLEYLKSFWSR